MEPVTIPLERNKVGKPRKVRVAEWLDEVAVVDGQDAERVLARHWTLHRARSGIYVREVGQGGYMLHRFVLELADWKTTKVVVDHINHDTLDNRRVNLRAVENVLNLANRGANRTAVYSLYRGVTYDLSRSKWKAQIGTEWGNKFLGRFAIEAEAALAYNKAALLLWGEHAQLNDLQES